MSLDCKEGEEFGYLRENQNAVPDAHVVLRLDTGCERFAKFLVPLCRDGLELSVCEKGGFRDGFVWPFSPPDPLKAWQTASDRLLAV